MQPWNKNNLINFGVIALILIVIASLIIAIFFVCKGGGFVSIILPGVAVGYACVVFFKKYYVKDVYKEQKKPAEKEEK